MPEESIASAKHLLTAQYAVMMSSASISVLCSSCLATMIWRKGYERFKTPKRRYLFALCLSDIAQSSALLFGPLMVPSNASPDFFLAKGNFSTCMLDGVTFLMGANMVPMYMVALCTSYLYMIKYNIKDKEFINKYDKWIHASIVLFSVAVSIFAAVTKNIYATESGAFCYPHKAYPYGCDENPEIYGECLYNKQGLLLSFALVVCVSLGGIIGVAVTMILLVRHVVSLGKRTRSRFRESLTLSTPHGSGIAFDSTQSRVSQDATQFSSSCSDESTRRRGSLGLKELVEYFKKSHETGELEQNENNESQKRPRSGSAKSYQSKTEIRAKQRERDLVTQALLYAGSFIFVYIWPFVGAIVFLAGGLQTQAAYFTNSIIGFTFFPLGGFLNVVVYTRQTCNIVRNRRSCSRISAFFAVLSNGGDLPEDCKVKARSRNDKNKTSSKKSNWAIFEALSVQKIISRRKESRASHANGSTIVDGSTPASTQKCEAEQETEMSSGGDKSEKEEEDEYPNSKLSWGDESKNREVINDEDFSYPESGRSSGDKSRVESGNQRDQQSTISSIISTNDNFSENEV